MIILTTSETQTFPIIPIKQSDINGNDIFMVFVNETTKETHSVVATIRYSVNDIFYIGSENFNFLKENTFYNLSVNFEGSGITKYKDRVFVTNQPESSYSINSGEYTTPAIDNNNYITI